MTIDPSIKVREQLREDAEGSGGRRAAGLAALFPFSIELKGRKIEVRSSGEFEMILSDAIKRGDEELFEWICGSIKSGHIAEWLGRMNRPRRIGVEDDLGRTLGVREVVTPIIIEVEGKSPKEVCQAFHTFISSMREELGPQLGLAETMREMIVKPRD